MHAFAIARLAAAALAAAGLAATAVPSTLRAAPVLDPEGDILPSLVGPSGADLDVLSTEATYARRRDFIRFDATLAGPVGGTPGAIYVYGLDRGAGAPLLLDGDPPLGAGIPFDSVLVVGADRTAAFIDIVNGDTVTPLGRGAVRIDGSSIAAKLPTGVAPSQGLAIEDWTFNLWPRNASDFINIQISDFAPDNSNAGLTVTPVPAAAPLLAGALAGLAALAARRRRARG